MPEKLVFRIMEPEKPAREIPVRDGLLIGRHPESHYVLADPKTSSRHARVVLVGERFHVEDLGSTNKTGIMGGPLLERGQRHPIGPGTKLILGRTMVEVISAQIREAKSTLESTVAFPEGSPSPDDFIVEPGGASTPEAPSLAGEPSGDTGVREAEEAALQAAEVARAAAQEAERMQKEAEIAAARRAEEKARREEEEKARREAEAARLREEEEARRREEEEARRREAEEARRREEEARRQEEEAARRREEEARQAAEQAQAATIVTGGLGAQDLVEEGADNDKTMMVSPLAPAQEPPSPPPLPGPPSPPPVPDPAATVVEAPLAEPSPPAPPVVETPAVTVVQPPVEGAPVKPAPSNPAPGGAAPTEAESSPAALQPTMAEPVVPRVVSPEPPVSSPPSPPAPPPVRVEPAPVASPLAGDDEESEGTIMMEHAGMQDLASDALLRTLRPRIVVVHDAIRRNVPLIFEDGALSPGFVVGRGDSKSRRVHCELEHGAVSGLHARIYLDRGRFFLEDLGSKNGTYLGNEMLAPKTPREIQAGQPLRFGSIHALFVTDGDAEGRKTSASLFETTLELLVSEGAITKAQRQRAEAQATENNQSPGEALLLSGILSVEDWVEAFERAETIQDVGHHIGRKRSTMGWIVIAVTVILVGIGALLVWQPDWLPLPEGLRRGD